jgi:dihydrodipicolinate synthase/N-acetylneuraminate lyase
MAEDAKYPLQGVVVSLNTPFDEAGEIDFASLERLVEWHLRCGAVGFLTPARAAEVDALSLDERIALVERVRDQVNGRATLIAGATATDPTETWALAHSAARIGCEGVLAEVPPAQRHDRSGLLQFVSTLASSGAPMLMIQDLEWEGFGIPVPLIREAFETIPAFRCLKVEVVPAGPKYTAVLEATGGRLHVSGGWAAAQMIEALDRGVDVFMPTAMSGIYALIYRLHRAGDRDTARGWFQKILPVVAFTHQHLDISIQFYKRLYRRRGLFRTTRTRRTGLVPYDEHHVRYGEELMQYLDEVEAAAGVLG